MKFNDIYRLKKKGKKRCFSQPDHWNCSCWSHQWSSSWSMAIFQFSYYLIPQQLLAQSVTPSACKHFLCFQVTTIPVIFPPYWTHFSFLFDVSFFISPKASECWNIQRLNPCIFFMSSLNLFHPISVITDVSQYSLNVSPKSEAKLHTYLHSDI